MATKAIKPKRDEGPKNWPSLPERAPSIVKPDQPGMGRVIALASLLMVAMGTLGMVAPRWGLRYILGPAWGFFWFALGVGGLLFHAFNEKDQQFRRTYAALGFLLFAAGAILRVWPVGGIGAHFLGYGVPCLGLALLFLTSVARNETDLILKTRIHNLLGLSGAIMALAGFFFSQTHKDFVAGEGVVLIFLGLFYLIAYIALHEPGSPQAYWAGMGIGAIGALTFVVALLRTLLPIATTSLPFLGPVDPDFIVPRGMLLMGLGLIYLLVSLSICSDNTLVTLTRRELAAFFYSPVAYLLILGMTLLGWFMFWNFVSLIRLASAGLLRGAAERGLPEPIVQNYILDFIPVFSLIFIIPLITMRLLSEEQRVGTLEVLLTAPVNEISVVLSKFFAALIFYFVALSSWGLFLVALRVMGETPFDYRPMLSFFMALLATGAGFLAMGLFFSSVTRNQIIAAVLTFAILLILTGLFFVNRQDLIPAPWNAVVRYGSHLDLWISSLSGEFAPRLLVFHISMAVFFLYLTTKVLESRKWK